MVTRSGSVRREARMARSGGRVARESARLGAIGAALPAATATTLAHRLPILAGLSSASALRQAAEFWRMTWEKPTAFWQGWLDAGPWPWDLWRFWAAFLWSGRSQPELPLRLAASSLRAMHRGLTPDIGASSATRAASVDAASPQRLGAAPEAALRAR
jgi:hypothetical protein